MSAKKDLFVSRAGCEERMTESEKIKESDKIKESEKSEKKKEKDAHEITDKVAMLNCPSLLNFL